MHILSNMWRHAKRTTEVRSGIFKSPAFLKLKAGSRKRAQAVGRTFPECGGMSPNNSPNIRQIFGAFSLNLNQNSSNFPQGGDGGERLKVRPEEFVSKRFLLCFLGCKPKESYDNTRF